MSDKRCRTLTAGELIRQLSLLDPSTPVVMSQEDEPCGDCGVRSIETREMQREYTYAAEPLGMDCWHEPQYAFDHCDPPKTVAYLDKHTPYRPVIDGEIAAPEIETAV